MGYIMNTPPAIGFESARDQARRVSRLQAMTVVRAAMTVAHAVPASVIDLAVAAACLGAMLIEPAGSVPLPMSRLALAIGLSTVIAGGVAVRRTAPLAGYLVGSMALVAQPLWMAPNLIAPYANLIGAYSLGLYATRGRARCGLLVVILGIVVYFSKSVPATATPVGVLLVWPLAWALGYGAARRHEQQQAARQAVRHAAVADERLRLARELHDLVGHTVNVMLVQAGAARRVLDHDPATTREFLTSLERVGQDAFTELDRMLGLLRNADPPTPGVADGDCPGENSRVDDDSRPGIAQLPRLLDRMAEVGVAVTFTIDPPTLTVPPNVGLSTYRIVQEALTNALIHGGARCVSVTLRHDGPALCIEVRDDGRGAAEGYLPGTGLLGISERVTALGGSAEHGSIDGGGFRLRATLPVS